MSTLASIDQNAFRQRVDDHIINTFGALIPEDQFTKLVDAQITAFFESQIEMIMVDVSVGGYNSSIRRVMKAPVTPFQQMVWLKLMPIVESKLTEYMKADNVTNPINKLMDELFKLPEFENHQVLTAQQMMLAMAGQLFASQLTSAGINARASVSNALMNAGQPVLAGYVMQGV